MNELAQWKKPGTNDYQLNDSIQTKFSEKGKIIERERQFWDRQGAEINHNLAGGDRGGAQGSTTGLWQGIRKPLNYMLNG